MRGVIWESQGNKVLTKCQHTVQTDIPSNATLTTFSNPIYVFLLTYALQKSSLISSFNNRQFTFNYTYTDSFTWKSHEHTPLLEGKQKI